MIEEHNLKPCPFCGHKPNIMATYNMGFLDIWYQCVMCGSNGPKVSADLRTDENNGITLCENCHNVIIDGSFHNIYGTKNIYTVAYFEIK